MNIEMYCMFHCMPHLFMRDIIIETLKVKKLSENKRYLNVKRDKYICQLRFL